jgi:hypothetical protein
MLTYVKNYSKIFIHLLFLRNIQFLEKKQIKSHKDVELNVKIDLNFLYIPLFIKICFFLCEDINNI